MDNLHFPCIIENFLWIILQLVFLHLSVILFIGGWVSGQGRGVSGQIAVSPFFRGGLPFFPFAQSGNTVNGVFP